MAGATARGSDQGGQGREAQAAVVAHKVEPHQVGTEVRHEEEFARGVHDGVVRVRAVLSVVDGARAVQVVCLGFDGEEGVEARGGGDIEGCYARAFAILAD